MASAHPAPRAPRSERTDIALCGLLLAVITVLRPAISNPIEAVGFLYVIPISLLASERGLRGGLIAAAGAILCTEFWSVVQDVPLGVLGYGARAFTFFGVGVFVGPQSQQRLSCSAAHAWNGALRQGDYLARLGGDEFLVLLPGSPAETAEAVARRILGAVPFNQTCSIGIATWDGEEPGYELVHRADQAMYAAKAAGGGRIDAGPVTA